MSENTHLTWLSRRTPIAAKSQGMTFAWWRLLLADAPTAAQKLKLRSECLVPLDALRLVPWILSFLPTPFDTHLDKSEVC